MTKKNMQIENGATLWNKRIAPLGGSSGIGLAVEQQVVDQRARPVIASSNTERIQKAVASVGGKAEGHRLDLSDEISIERFFRKLGAFDHLVYTAGALSAARAEAIPSRRAWGVLASVRHRKNGPRCDVNGR